MRSINAAALILALFFTGCIHNRIEKVQPTLFHSLPEADQNAALGDHTKDLRVVQGKLAKAKTDLIEQEKEISKQEMAAQGAKQDYQTAKEAVSRGKKAGVNGAELRDLERQKDISKHDYLLARERIKLARDQRKTLKNEVECLDAKIDVELAAIELDKIKGVHAYAQWKNPAAQLQISQFNKQLRKFELKESRREMALANAEYEHAYQLQKILILEKGHPQNFPAEKSRGSSDKPWTALFTNSGY